MSTSTFLRTFVYIFYDQKAGFFMGPRQAESSVTRAARMDFHKIHITDTVLFDLIMGAGDIKSARNE